MHFGKNAARPLTLLVASSSLLVACGDQPLPATGETTVELFESEVVGDDYVLRVRVPPDYDPSGPQTYPLVVQLDPTFAGLQQFDITVGLISDYAARDEWPEAIVVGVDYENPYLRDRDYLPPEPPDPNFEGDGADRFYAMLRDELVPTLEADHAIDPDRRYLLGHSNGGVFAWYAAFRYDPTEGAPLFAGVVAADNGYKQPLFEYEGWHDERTDDLPMQIYATRAVYNGAIQKVGFDAMIERLEDRDYPSLDLDSEVLETDHGGAVWPSYEHGLDFLFGGAP